MLALRGPAQAVGAQARPLPGLNSSSLGPAKQLVRPLASSRRSQLRIHALSTSPLQSRCRQQQVLAPAAPCTPSVAKQQQRRSVAARAIAGTLTATGIIPLGYDFLTFLTATVMVVPACKWLKISPVLGFLAAGIALEQAGCVTLPCHEGGVCAGVCTDVSPGLCSISARSRLTAQQEGEPAAVGPGGCCTLLQLC